MRWWLLFGVPLLAVAALWAWHDADSLVSPEPFVRGAGVLHVPTWSVTATEAGRVHSLLVEPGQMVQPGQALVRLDTATLQTRLEEQNTRLQQEQHKVAVSQASITALQQQYDTLQKTMAILERALWNHYEQSLGAPAGASRTDPAVSMTPYQEVHLQLTQIQAQAASVQASLHVAHSQKVQAEIAVAHTIQAVAAARDALQDAVIRSTHAGRVSRLWVQPADAMPAGALIATIQDLDSTTLQIVLAREHTLGVIPGDEVRWVPQAAPDHVVTARVVVVDTSPLSPQELQERGISSNESGPLFGVTALPEADSIARLPWPVLRAPQGQAWIRRNPQAIWPAGLTPG